MVGGELMVVVVAVGYVHVGGLILKFYYGSFEWLSLLVVAVAA